MNRKSVAVGLAIFVVLIAGLMLHAQNRVVPVDRIDRKDVRTIEAGGVATTLIKPDSARVFFGVQTQAKSVREARADNAALVRKVMDALTNLKLPGLQMKTTDVEVHVLYSDDREPDSPPKVVGYRVNNTFTVLVESEDASTLSTAAARVVDTGLENGVNQLQQVHFYRKDLAAVRRDLLARAVVDAVANARSMAGALSANLTDTIEIIEEPSFHAGDLRNVVGFVGGGATETPVVAGDLEISCRVRVTCTY